VSSVDQLRRHTRQLGVIALRIVRAGQHHLLRQWRFFRTNHGGHKHVIGASVGDLAFSRSDASISRKLVITGYLVTAAFFGSIFMWAAFVPISSAAIALGVVSKDGYRKTVQHLEGGIIHKILVKDGDTVAVGQKVIELADVQSRADFYLLRKQKIIAEARVISLLSIQSGNDKAGLTEDFFNRELIDPALRDMIEGKINASIVANQLHKGQLEIIERQIAQAKHKIDALNDEKVALQRSKKLVEEELKQYTALRKDGLVTRNVIFDLKRKAVDTEVEYSENRVAVQSTEQEINELKMQKSILIASHSERINDELDSVREELVYLDENLSKTEDTLGRTIIRAPTSGIVVNLRVNTIGGVISSGEPLLDIVPSTGKLIIDARVNPMDRDTVLVGHTAEVRLLAFNRRLTDPVQGRVAHISADRLIDGVTNESYYQAKIELLEDLDGVLHGGQVYPGMQAEVLVVTGSRTVLSYLTAPVSKSFNRSFRED
jgi:HlyD family secretion protein